MARWSLALASKIGKDPIMAEIPLARVVEIVLDVDVTEQTNPIGTGSRRIR